MARARKPRNYSLRRASSVVFALISILPLLLFAYTLYALDVLHHHVAQIALGSALVLSMIGFYIYQVMMSRLSDILRDIEEEESAPPQAGPRGGAQRAGSGPGHQEPGHPGRPHHRPERHQGGHQLHPGVRDRSGYDAGPGLGSSDGGSAPLPKPLPDAVRAAGRRGAGAPPSEASDSEAAPAKPALEAEHSGSRANRNNPTGA